MKILWSGRTSGYVVAGYTRHHTYEGVMEEHVPDITTPIEEGSGKPMGWEDFDYLGTPEAALVIADPVFQEKIYSLWNMWADYLIDYEIEVLFSLLAEVDDDRWNLWDAYEKRTVFEHQRVIYWIAGNLIFLSPYSKDDWGGSLAESVVLWEAAGGKREGNWMEVYKQSPEYEDWLNQVFAEIAETKEMKTENYNPKSKEDQYLETIRQVKPPFYQFILERYVRNTTKNDRNCI